MLKITEKIFSPHVVGILAALLVCFSSLHSNALLGAQDDFDIAVSFERSDLHQVYVQFEHKGVVIVDKAGQEESAETLPLDVIAKLNYTQRFTGSGKDLQSIRNYEISNADIEIDKGETDSKLATNNRLIVARIQPTSNQRLQMASISDVLDQRELELIRNPADPLSFVNVFKKSNVRIGQKWKVGSEFVADFLAVDSVFENGLELTLKSVEDDIAKVYIVGSVKAEIDDVTTEMEISSIALIDLSKNYVKALRTTIREDRSPGQVAPGFKGQTKIDLKMKPTSNVSELTNEALAKSKSKRIERRLKWETNKGDFRVTYDPRWRIIASEPDATVMRFLDQGQLLAQCNIVQLDARPASKPLKLQEFKTEVEKIVAAEESASVVKSQELKTRHDLRALRVVVEGMEEQVPIKWIYYHVAHDDGRRLTFVFTMEQAVSSRFDIADKLLVNETRFKPRAAQPVKTAGLKNTGSRTATKSQTLQPKR